MEQIPWPGRARFIWIHNELCEGFNPCTVVLELGFCCFFSSPFLFLSWAMCGFSYTNLLEPSELCGMILDHCKSIKLNLC